MIDEKTEHFAGETEELKESLPQCHFVHNKFHTDMGLNLGLHGEKP
jgi:hypothetical protein